MDFSKIKKITFILLILFILLFPFWCVRGLCSEDSSFNRLDSLVLVNGVFLENSNYYGVYTSVKGGNVYKLIVPDLDVRYRVSFTNDVPAVGTGIISSFEALGDYEFTAPSDGYIVIYINLANNEDFVNGLCIQQVGQSMEATVFNLSQDVGINSLWNVFHNAIPYISVVGIFVFGFVIVTFITTEISKGKEGL